MAIPTSKTELLDAISHRFEKLDVALDAVPPDLCYEKTMEGHAKGTVMSVNNLVSYLVGWNELVLKWLSLDDNGLPVTFPEVGFKWNQLGLLAQKFYADYADFSFAENQRNLRGAKDRLVVEVTKRSNNELYGEPWHGKWTKGRMIQFNSSSPYENARVRLRQWTRNKNGSLGWSF